MITHQEGISMRQLHRWWTPCRLRLDEPNHAIPPLPELKPEMTTQVGSRCVKGPHREVNEDRCYTDLTEGLYFVVDGMGGHYGGAEASHLLMEELPSQLARLADQPLDVDLVEKTLQSALDETHHRMVEYAEHDVRYHKMGATLALAVIRDDTLFVSRVGDCRIYIVRESAATALTDDQTFVQLLVNAGMLTPAEAHDDPRRHLVLNCVSADKLHERVHVDSIPLCPGDAVVLATDGLTTAVSDERLAEIVDESVLAQSAADKLVLEALNHGSKDNVACVVVKTSHCAKPR